MLKELKDIIDKANGVSILLNKAEVDGEYAVTLVVRGDALNLPPLRIEGPIDELDAAVSKAFTEASSVVVEAANSIEGFKEAAQRSVDAAKEDASKKQAPKDSAGTPAKRKRSSKKEPPKPSPETKPTEQSEERPAENTNASDESDAQSDLFAAVGSTDAATQAAFEKLGMLKPTKS